MRILSPKSAALGVLAIAILLTGNPLSGCVSLRNGASRALKNSETLADQYRTPRSGEYILAPEVQDMLSLLREHQVETFKLDRSFFQDDQEIVQTVNEAAWPILVRDESPYRILSGPLPDGCNPIAHRGDVTLVFCAQ